MFQLERPLAASAEGCCVYLARMRGSCERVAVKCVNKDTAPRIVQKEVSSATFIYVRTSGILMAHTEPLLRAAQVEHEARLHLRLLHPHVVRCYAYLEDVTHTYLVMEYAEQGDLRKALHSYTERSLRDSVVQPLLQALSYIHSKVQ